MDSKTKLLKIGKFIGSFILFTGIILWVQSYNLEKITTQENFTGFFQPQLEKIFINKCAEQNISSEICLSQFGANITQSLNDFYSKEVQSPLGNTSIAKVHTSTVKYKTWGIILSIFGFVIMLFSTIPKIKVLSSMASSFIGSGGSFILLGYVLPRIMLSKLQLQDFMQIVITWVEQNIMNFEIYAGMIFIILGIVFYIAYFVLSKIIQIAEKENPAVLLNKPRSD